MAPSDITRRRFVHDLGAGAASLAVLPHLGPRREQTPRPNILFMMSDDHAYQALSCYGGRINRTPNIDRLAPGGVRFTRSFCTNYATRSAAARDQTMRIQDRIQLGYDLKLDPAVTGPILGPLPLEEQWIAIFDRLTDDEKRVWRQAYAARNEEFHTGRLEGEALTRWRTPWWSTRRTRGRTWGSTAGSTSASCTRNRCGCPSSCGSPEIKRHYGIRTERYKLIHFYDDIDAWELYDLEADPREVRDVYEEPAYAAIVVDLEAELEALRRRYRDVGA